MRGLIITKFVATLIVSMTTFAAADEIPAVPASIDAPPGVSQPAMCCVSDQGCCDFTPAATCCSGYADGCRCCCCGHPCCYMPGIHKRWRCGKLKWCRVWTTGDMYPHYAYEPMHHGYYYFRPYNYINIAEHKHLITRLGGDSRHPYSLALFDPIYEKHYEVSPPRLEPTVDELIPVEDPLPNLEELLN